MSGVSICVRKQETLSTNGSSSIWVETGGGSTESMNAKRVEMKESTTREEHCGGCACEYDDRASEQEGKKTEERRRRNDEIA